MTIYLVCVRSEGGDYPYAAFSRYDWAARDAKYRESVTGSCYVVLAKNLDEEALCPTLSSRTPSVVPSGHGRR